MKGKTEYTRTHGNAAPRRVRIEFVDWQSAADYIRQNHAGGESL